ncbi:hypothetical protein G5I_11388 [Acromyrmex echinatior]|uniref:Uncharacterized protein n=1 Tax=Acromyrmex echinatior TaxID=103372 RepID=F4WZG6_ACREC|nr:hypothetical protein G5I_11388 [Acromyrmex echinatior]
MGTWKNSRHEPPAARRFLASAENLRRLHMRKRYPKPDITQIQALVDVKREKKNLFFGGGSGVKDTKNARNSSRKDTAKYRSDEIRSQNDHRVIDNRNSTGDDPSVHYHELERKRSVFPPVSFRLPDRKRSEKNTNSPRFLQAVSRFVDARKKFVTKVGRVRT